MMEMFCPLILRQNEGERESVGGLAGIREFHKVYFKIKSLFPKKCAIIKHT